MEENYLISIVGKQCLDGEEDVIEVTTIGKYAERDGKKLIMYTEYDNDDIYNKRSSVIKVDTDHTVTISRSSPYPSRLILQKGKRHQCHYSTPAGSLLIGVFTDKVNSTLTANGGRLEVSYTLDFNGDLASKNEFIIEIKEKGVN